MSSPMPYGGKRDGKYQAVVAPKKNTPQGGGYCEINQHHLPRQPVDMFKKRLKEIPNSAMPGPSSPSLDSQWEGNVDVEALREQHKQHHQRYNFSPLDQPATGYNTGQGHFLDPGKYGHAPTRELREELAKESSEICGNRSSEDEDGVNPEYDLAEYAKYADLKQLEKDLEPEIQHSDRYRKRNTTGGHHHWNGPSRHPADKQVRGNPYPR